MSKISGRYNRGLTDYQLDKCKKDTIVFDGDNCVSNALNFCLKLKREGRKDFTNKLLENIFQLRAHNGSGVDTWIILNNLPRDKRSVNIIKIVKGIVELNVFNGFFSK